MEQPELKPNLLPTAAQWKRITSIANWAAKSGIKGCLRPQTAAFKIMLGLEHGLSPAVALQEIHLLDQRLSLSAVTQAALIYRSPHHNIRIIGLDNEEAVLEAWRTDDPDNKRRFSLTLEEARAKGYTKSPKGHDMPAWTNTPMNMLLHRVITTISKLMFPELTLGVGYIPDELNAETDEDGCPIEEDAPDTPDDSVSGFTSTTLQEPEPAIPPPDVLKTALEPARPQTPRGPAAAAAEPEPAPAPAPAPPPEPTPSPQTNKSPGLPVTIKDIQALVDRLIAHDTIRSHNQWADYLSSRYTGVTSAEMLGQPELVDLAQKLTYIVTIFDLLPKDHPERPRPDMIFAMTDQEVMSYYNKATELKTPFAAPQAAVGNLRSLASKASDPSPAL